MTRREIDPYWQEAVECALEEAGVAATKEQVAVISQDIERAAGMESEAKGYHNIPNPLQSEVDARDRALKAADEERERQVEIAQKEIDTHWRPLVTRLRWELEDARSAS